jgi:hypothetical protein
VVGINQGGYILMYVNNGSKTAFGCGLNAAEKSDIHISNTGVHYGWLPPARSGRLDRPLEHDCEVRNWAN